MQTLVIQKIVVNNLTQLHRLHQTLQMYVSLGPYAKIVTKYTSEIHTLK